MPVARSTYVAGGPMTYYFNMWLREDRLNPFFK